MYKLDQVHEAPDIGEVLNDLESMRLRAVRFARFRGIGGFLPTDEEWSSGRVSRVGHMMRGLLENGVSLGLRSITEPIPRYRRHTTGFLGLDGIGRLIGSQELTVARITEIQSDIEVGHPAGGRHELPVVGLKELGRRQPSYNEYALTVADLAHVVQAGTVELRG